MTPLESAREEYRRACKRADRAQARYQEARAAELAALQAAYDAGVTLQELGQVRGVTRQAVHYALEQARKG